MLVHNEKKNGVNVFLFVYIYVNAHEPMTGKIRFTKGQTREKCG
ncbi:hypothetical protein [Methanosarcina sp. 1.H.A.2.2]|nr:hypothetical protein [Methanosarcina sp. 1.H.A.2.2]